ncbi:GNAT family N-acetyltransferase [Roseomonas gilardii]|uniref:GNAT family N-acetyltransferase n=1 Tax=Roseomonas gilardii TaxID=257708 RepID=UPI0004846E5C|nr:GNAT family N-acetyltransferase [Roseomonas gilardii]SUE45036.1 Acetyltransferase (GNAT) family [Roseomonas gilardii subsp. rosea]
MDVQIAVTDSPAEAERETVLRGLIAFNTERAGPLEMRPLAVILRDPGTGQPLGGLIGRTARDWFFVEMFHLPEEARGRGTGRRILIAAEEEAVRRGCRYAWLDTFSFQARGFYEKLGYSVFGTLEDYPAGHSRYFLRKTLSREPRGEAG